MQGKDLINQIFSEFLFSSILQANKGNEDNTVCRIVQKTQSRKNSKAVTRFMTKASRESAYNLLLSLIRKSPALMSDFLQNHMNPMMTNIKQQ